MEEAKKPAFRTSTFLRQMELERRIGVINGYSMMAFWRGN